MENTTTTTSTIHIKSVLNNEFRRFSLDKANFAQLLETIRSVYSLSNSEVIKTSFIDEEKDLIVMSTDEELLYASELVRPLRIIVTLASEQLLTPADHVTNEPEQTVVEKTEQVGKRGRGRGKGKQEWTERKKWRDQQSLTKEERVTAKISRITETIEHVESLLLTDLPAHRVRTLNWKLEKLKSKLEDEKIYLDQLKNAGPPSNTETPESSEACSSDLRTRGCGGGGRGGRGGRCGGKGRMDPENSGWKGNRNPELTQIWEKISACRDNLKEARKSGNKEEIDKCIKELDEAKIQKWELRQKMKEEREQKNSSKFAAEKAHKRECLKNLREAKASGDAQKIDECKKAVIAANEALQQAKVATA